MRALSMVSGKPAEMKRVQHEMIEPGDQAPDIALPDHEGNLRHLSELWSKPLVLLFVRHLGCPFCREHLGDVRDDYDKIRAAGGEVAVVTMGLPKDADWLRSKLRLPFVCLSDPQQQAYRAYGIPRGGFSKVSGPAIWRSGLRAMLRGGIGVPKGDLRQLHGTAVIAPSGTLRYIHRPKNSADQPSTEEILAVLASIEDETASL